MARVPGQLTHIVIGAAIGAAVTVIVGVLSLLLTHPHFYLSPPSPPGNKLPPSQEIYKAMLQRNIKSLDRGLLAYTPIGDLKTGDSTDFDVVVVDVGRGPQTTIVINVGGLLVYQTDVPTGGIVGIQAVLCQNLKCDSESSPTQPVLLPGHKAIWQWHITAGTPGPAKIILRADTYDQGSQQTLREEIIPITGNVVPTPAFNQQQNHKEISNLSKSGVNLIVTVGSIATAIVAVGGLVGWIVMKRRQKKTGNSETNATHAEFEGRQERPSTGTLKQPPKMTGTSEGIKMDPRSTSYNEVTSVGVEIYWRVSPQSDPWIQDSHGVIATDWEAIMAIAVGSSTLSTFVHAIAAELGKRTVDGAPKAVRASVHLMKRLSERTIEAVEIETKVAETATTILLIGGELPDEGRLALLDMDFADPKVSGKVLSWNSQLAAWAPFRNN